MAEPFLRETWDDEPPWFGEGEPPAWVAKWAEWAKQKITRLREDNKRLGGELAGATAKVTGQQATLDHQKEAIEGMQAWMKLRVDSSAESFAPGAEVEIYDGERPTQLRAHITEVLLGKDKRVRYAIAWWYEGQRLEATVDASEVKLYEDILPVRSEETKR